MWRRAWIWKRELKSGAVRYCVRWWDERGKVRMETVGTDRKLAEKVRCQKEYELNNGMLDKPERIRLSDFVREHLELMKGRVAPGSLRDQKETLKQFQSSMGDKWLEQIKLRDIEGWFAKRQEDVRPATANKNLRTLKAIFNHAKKRGYLTENPFAEVKSVREHEKEIRVLSVEEIGSLLAACPDERWRTFVFLALTTGMRRGELSALRWEDVDLKKALLVVRSRDDHPTKSRRSRYLALVPEAVEMLKGLRRRFRGEYVLENTKGGPLQHNLSRQFDEIVQKAGIRRCTLHDLRRTFASHLAMVNVNEAVVQKAAGHASISTTLRYYTNILPDVVREAQNRLPYLRQGDRHILRPRDARSVNEPVPSPDTVSNLYHGPDLKVVEKSA